RPGEDPARRGGGRLDLVGPIRSDQLLEPLGYERLDVHRLQRGHRNGSIRRLRSVVKRRRTPAPGSAAVDRGEVRSAGRLEPGARGRGTTLVVSPAQAPGHRSALTRGEATSNSEALVGDDRFGEAFEAHLTSGADRGGGGLRLRRRGR